MGHSLFPYALTAHRPGANLRRRQRGRPGAGAVRVSGKCGVGSTRCRLVAARAAGLVACRPATETTCRHCTCSARWRRRCSWPCSLMSSARFADRVRVQHGRGAHPTHRRRRGLDVAVLTSALVDQLAGRGTLAPGSRRDVARVGVGVGVRSDAASSEIGTPEAFKALLLDARSVTFTAEGRAEPPWMTPRTPRRRGGDTSPDDPEGPRRTPTAVARGGAAVVLSLVAGSSAWRN